ncbi:uncharacterized protein LOC115999461 [Ipomoea triloba]|uniref:uncharacterized protein LOC115999461 n=1 Tax=Ipomoea triloba TaxID=35885 RepID=UPI00125DA3C7|nr:uncharacterized protein LOC115999461 [Ipomoea triloba]
MSMLYILAKDISPQSYRKAIRLRLIRTYIVTEGRNKSAIKSQECLFHDIEGTYVHASIHANFKDQFSNLLKEGKVYAVKNFVVVSYYYQYKTTQHKYMMKFNHYTTIERHRRKGFPSLLFRIKPIEDLLAGKVEEKQLIDVIGRVVEFYSPKDKVIAGFPTQLVDFLIEDSNEVRISSSYTATKVLFNLDCQEFADFRNRLIVAHSKVFQWCLMVTVPIIPKLLWLSARSEICDLYERAEEGYYCVPGTIVSIESGKKWFYNSCRKPGCFKSLIFTETYYYCETCKTNWAKGNVRYRAKMHVPAEFDQLRNKSMVFRINLKNELNPAKPISVLSVMQDEELEAQYCPSMVDDHDELSRMVEEEADDLESDESESGDEAISPSMQPDLKLKGVDKPQDEVDTGAIKRRLLDQFSSSQNLKKSRPVVIKQEKN